MRNIIAAIAITVGGLVGIAPAAHAATVAAPSENCPYYLTNTDSLLLIRKATPLPLRNWEAHGYIRLTLTCGVVTGGHVTLSLQRKTGEVKGRAIFHTESFASAELQGKHKGYVFSLNTEHECNADVQWRLRLFFGPTYLTDETHHAPQVFFYPGPNAYDPGKRLDCTGHPSD